MDTRKLEVLLKAVELGSFSKAAEKLGYSQSALVHMMNALEQDIGVPLLLRNYSGITLSPAGKQLKPIFCAFLELEGELRRQAAEFTGETPGKVRIVSVPSIATCWLPDVITGMRKKAPELEIDLVVSGQDVGEIVSRGDADLGFTAEEYAGGNEWLALREDPFCAAVPASMGLPEGEPVPIGELARHTVLIPKEGKNNAAILSLKKQAPEQISVSAHGGSVLLSMVEHGLGVAVLSSLYRSICPPDVRMLPLDPPVCRTMGIISRCFRRLTPAQARFVAYAKSMI